MRRGQPSLSARGVAITRATLPRPVTAQGLPEAERLIAESLGGLPRAVTTAMFHYLAARTRFFDRAMLDAMQRGIAQIVTVGAGYDTRSLLFRSDGVRFFEIDHPDTQEDKRHRLGELDLPADDIAFVAVDFTTDRLEERLRATGHDRGATSFFLLEGVVLYLSKTDIDSLLAALYDCAGTDSRLALSIPIHADTYETEREQGRSLLHQRLRLAGEQPLTVFTRAEALAALQGNGWTVLQALDPADLEPQAHRGHSLLVECLATTK